MPVQGLAWPYLFKDECNIEYPRKSRLWCLTRHQKGHPNHKICRTSKFYKLGSSLHIKHCFKRCTGTTCDSRIKEFTYYITCHKGRINVFVMQDKVRQSFSGAGFRSRVFRIGSGKAGSGCRFWVYALSCSGIVLCRLYTGAWGSQLRARLCGGETGIIHYLHLPWRLWLEVEPLE